MKKNLIILFLSLFMAHFAMGSGFQVKLQGHRQTGMGNTGVATSVDASAIFFNPGALSLMEGNQVAFGVSAVMASNSYYNPETGYTSQTTDQVGTPFYFYGAWGPTDSKFKFGLAVYTPYGNNLAWEDDWEGRYQLEDISLASIFFQPTVSYQITEKLGIGAGFVYATGAITLIRQLGLPDPFSSAFPDPTIELDGSASGTGFNVGVYYQASEKLSFGVNYRSEVEVEVDGGDVTISDVPAALASVLPASTSFDAKLPLPSNLAFGAAFSPNEKLTLTAEATLTGWSAYEELRFDFADPIGATSPEEIEAARVSASPRNYEDTWAINLGAEYIINDIFAARGGIYFDQTPVQAGYMTAETADQDRIGLTAGLGIKPSERFNIDVYFLYIDGQEAGQTYEDGVNAGTIPEEASTQSDWGILPGRYHLNAVIPGLAVSYNF